MSSFNRRNFLNKFHRVLGYTMNQLKIYYREIQGISNRPYKFFTLIAVDTNFKKFALLCVTEITCPIPATPKNGRIELLPGLQRERIVYRTGSLLRFSCLPGHQLIGQGSIICTENGTWSHSPPICKHIWEVTYLEEVHLIVVTDQIRPLLYLYRRKIIEKDSFSRLNFFILDSIIWMFAQYTDTKIWPP